MALQDRHNRPIRYLRLSVTPACSMRCVYCRPAVYHGTTAQSLLAPDELQRLVRHLVLRHGLRKIRITGGEPTARPDLLEIIARIAAIDGIEDLAMTTNGLTLERQAAALAAAGLRRVNVSLDSLRAARFAQITGVNGLHRVLRGLDAAEQAGLGPIKLNTVVVRGENDHELPDLLDFAFARGLEIRFIELMPMGPLAAQWASRFVDEAEMRQRLSGRIAVCRPMAPSSSAARRHRVALDDGRQGTIGFITAMSCNFCAACDRIRIASDGQYYPCLMDKPAGNLLAALRPALDPDRLDAALAAGLAAKADVHPATGVAVMTSIGG
jgi:cyclic pyranopterin phosphate synthase